MAVNFAGAVRLAVARLGEGERRNSLNNQPYRGLAREIRVGFSRLVCCCLP
jgi:hypothetical protein